MAPSSSRPLARRAALVAAGVLLTGIVGATAAQAQTVTTGTGSTTSTTEVPATTTTTEAEPTTTTTESEPTTSTTADQPDGPDGPRPIPPGATSSASASTVAPGGSITVSGSGCSTAGEPGEAIVVIGNPPDGPFVDATKVANADGTWSITVTIPADFPIGDVLVRSACLDAPGADTGFEYEPFTVAVRAAAATPVPANPSFTG